jgi:hypothetical protein
VSVVGDFFETLRSKVSHLTAFVALATRFGLRDPSLLVGVCARVPLDRVQLLLLSCS